jgi:hypothetical protein
MHTGAFWSVYGFDSWHGVATTMLYLALALFLLVTTDFRRPTPLWRPFVLLATGLGTLLFAGSYLSLVLSQDVSFGNLYQSKFPYDSPRSLWGVRPAFGLHITFALGLTFLFLGCFQLRGALLGAPRSR